MLETVFGNIDAVISYFYISKVKNIVPISQEIKCRTEAFEEIGIKSLFGYAPVESAGICADANKFGEFLIDRQLIAIHSVERGISGICPFGTRERMPVAFFPMLYSTLPSDIL